MRLIDADTLVKNFAVPSNELFYAGTVLDYIKEAPTVDAVEVVRCRECKYSDQYTEYLVYCTEYQTGKVIDGFCNLGKRGDGD